MRWLLVCLMSSEALSVILLLRKKAFQRSPHQYLFSLFFVGESNFAVDDFAVFDNDQSR